jgi:hypothetical protein
MFVVMKVKMDFKKQVMRMDIDVLAQDPVH